MTKKKVFQIMAVAMLCPGSFVLGLVLGVLAAALLIIAVCAALALVALKWCGTLSVRTAEWLDVRAQAFFARFRGSVPKNGTDGDRSRPASPRGAALPGDHVPLPEIVRVPRRDRWLQ
ncbi:MAG: hypothetical protein LAN84_09770 [Acidobacteriia bacterium]|nr:hypothetical protein [Terriglobia bacterium]